MADIPEGASQQELIDSIPLGLLDMDEPVKEEVKEEVVDETEDPEGESEVESEEVEDESEDSKEESEDEPDYLLIGEEKVSYDDIGEVWAKKSNLDKGFTQKMQTLSEERKAFETEQATWKEGAATERQATIDRLEQFDKALAKIEGEEPDWQSIRQELPAEEYAARVADWQLVKGNREKVKAEAESLRQEQSQEMQSKVRDYAESERTKLMDLEPEFGKTEYAAQWVEYVKTQGFTDEEIGQTLNHRIYLLVDKARKYDGLMADGVKDAVSKKVKDAPVVKPGVHPAKGKRTRKASEEAQKRAMRTGKLDDAIRVGSDELFDL